MTENKAIKVLEKPSKHIRMVHKTKNEMEFYTFSSDLVEAFEIAIKALEKVQAFETIGTIYEFKALKECFGHTVPKSRGKAIYDKAIDDFVKRLKPIIDEKIKGWTNSDDLRRWCEQSIDEVAAEMKKGDLK